MKDQQTIVLTLSLFPLAIAAWQDVRTRQVSNWITIPLFFAAWPLAWALQGWEGVIVVGIMFFTTYLAMPYGFGAADGKLTVFLTAVGGIPAVLLALGTIALLFVIARRRPEFASQLPFVDVRESGVHVAGSVGFFAAIVLLLLLVLL